MCNSSSEVIFDSEHKKSEKKNSCLKLRRVNYRKYRVYSNSQ